MLAVAKTPLIDLRIEGEIPSDILSVLKAHFGIQLKLQEDKAVPIKETKWYKEMSQKMTVGKNISTQRNLLDWTQLELGSKLGGLSRQYISDLENDRRATSKDVAKKLADIFGIPVDNFL
jgi:DNA-binding XRE family transcriptional regulator